MSSEHVEDLKIQSMIIDCFNHILESMGDEVPLRALTQSFMKGATKDLQDYIGYSACHVEMFLKKFPNEFLIDDQKTVSICARRRHQRSANLKIVWIFRNLMPPPGRRITVTRLRNMAAEHPDLMNLPFKSLESILEFLRSFPEHFYLYPDNTVELLPEFLSSMQSTAVHIIKAMISSEWYPLKLTCKRLADIIRVEVPSLLPHVGATERSLRDFMVSSGQFTVNKNDVVSLLRHGHPEPSEIPLALCHTGLIAHVAPDFGFVPKTGLNSSRCIYFDQTALDEDDAAVIANPPDLTISFSPGQQVSCLFVPWTNGNIPNKKFTHKALRIWTGEKPMVERTLRSPVLFGFGVIKYISDHVGYLVIQCKHNNDKALDELEIAVFNRKHCLGVTHINLDSLVSFVAVKSLVQMPAYKVWDVVCMWPQYHRRTGKTNSSERSFHLLNGTVIQLYVSGGVILVEQFGRISFLWQTVLDHHENHIMIPVGKGVSRLSVGDYLQCLFQNGAIKGTGSKEILQLVPLECPSMPDLVEDDDYVDDNHVENKHFSSTKSEIQLPKVQDEQHSACKSDSFKTSVEDLEIFANSVLIKSFTAKDEWLSSSLLDQSAIEKLPLKSRNAVGIIAYQSIYGGLIEWIDRDLLVPFSAHCFYLDNKPVTHTICKKGCQVHFDVTQNQNILQASKVWMLSP